MYLITIDTNVQHLSQKIVNSVTTLELLDVINVDSCRAYLNKNSKKPIISESICQKKFKCLFFKSFIS